MRRALIALVFLLAACSSGKPAPTSTSAVYLDAVRPLLPHVADASLLGIAHEVCADLASGVPYPTLVSTILSEPGLGLDATDTGRLIGASVAAYCPVQVSAIPSR